MRTSMSSCILLWFNNCDCIHFQIDIHAEELGNNLRPAVGLHGDLKSVLTQVLCNSSMQNDLALLAYDICHNFALQYFWHTFFI